MPHNTKTTQHNSTAVPKQRPMLCFCAACCVDAVLKHNGICLVFTRVWGACCDVVLFFKEYRGLGYWVNNSGPCKSVENAAQHTTSQHHMVFTRLVVREQRPLRDRIAVVKIWAEAKNFEDALHNERAAIINECLTAYRAIYSRDGGFTQCDLADQAKRAAIIGGHKCRRFSAHRPFRPLTLGIKNTRPRPHRPSVWTKKGGFGLCHPEPLTVGAML